MSWKVKISVGEVSAEIEIPLTDRSHISLDDDGTAKKTIKVFESLSQKVLEAANSFEKSRAALYPPIVFDQEEVKGYLWAIADQKEEISSLKLQVEALHQKLEENGNTR